MLFPISVAKIVGMRLYKYSFAHILIWYESTIGIYVPHGIS